jgi:GNAT superfamily N-acetyltransferase
MAAPRAAVSGATFREGPLARLPFVEGIAIRPIGPGDRAALEAGFDRLSDESRYLRFFAPVSRLSESQLRYLTDVDHHDHEALVAIEEATGEALGVARYVRTGPEEAEPAVVVVDDWQGKGIGSALLDGLADRAREEGVRTFVAPVLAHNRAAIAALDHLGDMDVAHHGQEVELRIALREAPGAAPSLRAALRRAAGGSIRPAVSLAHRLAVGQRSAPGETANAIVVESPDTRQVCPPVPRATRLAEALGAELHLVSVREGERLAEVGAELRGRGLAVVEHHRAGDLAAVLLDVAVTVGARMIVVDGSERGGLVFSGAWEHVAHHAPCDVLVAR